MRQLRRDALADRWVIMATERAHRPSDYDASRSGKGKRGCPFDEGAESETPPEVWAIRETSFKPDGPGWLTRVIPNKFPALRLDGELGQETRGLYERANGLGAHEVIIETPRHERHLDALTSEEFIRVFRTYQDRLHALKEDGRLKYIMIFKNVGRRAGASLEHLHSQLVALPFIPKRVADELAGAGRYFEEKKRCGYCDLLDQEGQARERIVCQNDAFFAFCPYTARFAFECWMFPKDHAPDFGRVTEGKIRLFAELLKELLRRLRKALKDPAYNLLIHSAPTDPRYRDAYHWHIEIVPRLSEIVGFEWGTGIYINAVPPEAAAKTLRAAGPSG